VVELKNYSLFTYLYLMIMMLCVKGDTQNDVLLFTLAALLSSTLVYNSRGTIDQQAIDRLRSAFTAFILSMNSKTFK